MPATVNGAGIGGKTIFMNYIAYNNLGKGTPTKWKLFSDGHEAYRHAMAMGDDWDMTNTDCFKDWFPHIDFTKG